MTDLVVSDEAQAALAQYADYAPTDEDSDYLAGGGGDIQRIKILPAGVGLFENTSTEENFKEFSGVVLGTQQQRAAFVPGNTGADSKICSAKNGKVGFPEHERFPETVTFTDSKTKLEETVAAHPDFSDAAASLDCGTCNMQKWGTHPERNVPFCAEQSTLAIFSLDDEGEPVLYTLSLSRTGMKAIKQFVRPFRTQKIPLFSQFTTISLNVEKGAGNKYSVPVLKTTGPTDPTDWAAYAKAWDRMKDYLTRQAASETSVDVVASTSNDAPSDNVSASFPGATTVTDAEVIDL